MMECIKVGTLFRIRPGIVDLAPKSGPTPNNTTPKMPGAVPTDDRHKSIPIHFGPVSGCFDHDPKLCNYEITQPSTFMARHSSSLM